jgi:hypothetical protein
LSGNSTPEEPNDDTTKFFRLLGDNKQKLYPNCKYTKLSFIVKLLHIKCLGGWTNKSFTMLLQLFNEVLPKCDVELPNLFYEAKKTIWDLGLDYKKIDACVNDCMLYWKENYKMKKFLVCGVSRWTTRACK